MNTLTLSYLGKRCQKYRKKIGYYQRQIASDTGYSIESISAFENGRSDNARILLWYFQHGLTIEYIVKGLKEDEI